MEIICESCERRFNITDEKIPKGKVLSLSCPKCKNKITLDMRENDQSNESSVAQEQAPVVRKPSDEDYGYDDYTADTNLVFYDPDIRLGLILASDPHQEGKIKKAMEEMAYQGISAPNTRDAIGKMRFHYFELIVLSEDFDGQKLAQSPIISYLNRLSMGVRRRVFLALISERFKTMDNMMAFALSANTVINSNELDQMSLMLGAAFAEHEKFYKIYYETLKEVGKA
jgi:uncharacterized protein YbaR (Trm112 family)